MFYYLSVLLCRHDKNALDSFNWNYSTNKTINVNYLNYKELLHGVTYLSSLCGKRLKELWKYSTIKFQQLKNVLINWFWPKKTQLFYNFFCFACQFLFLMWLLLLTAKLVVKISLPNTAKHQTFRYVLWKMGHGHIWLSPTKRDYKLFLCPPQPQTVNKTLWSLTLGCALPLFCFVHE